MEFTEEPVRNFFVICAFEKADDSSLLNAIYSRNWWEQQNIRKSGGAISFTRSFDGTGFVPKSAKIMVDQGPQCSPESAGPSNWNWRNKGQLISEWPVGVLIFSKKPILEIDEFLP